MVVLNLDAKVPALQNIQKMASGPRQNEKLFSNLYSKFNHQPKMTSGSKTIMSPLTTMSKKMMPPPQVNMAKITSAVPAIKTNIVPASAPQSGQGTKTNAIPAANKNVMTDNKSNMQISLACGVKVTPKVEDSAIKIDNVKSTPDAEPLKLNDNNNNSDKNPVKIQEITPVVALKSKFVDNYKPARVSLSDCNVYITCKICTGYLIEATTIVECLHTFCHSCLIKHLQNKEYCPTCGLVINKTKTNIKYDATTQMIVYKLVPGLYEQELLRKRAFYKSRPQDALIATPEQRGDDTEHLIFSASDNISLSLDFSEKETLAKNSEDNQFQNLMKTKYLQCPAGFKIEHLKRFVKNKFLINSKSFTVEISYKVKTIVLPDHYTLMDVAYIYTWKREAPMGFFFRIIAKDSKLNDLPDILNRQSPTISILPSIKEEPSSASVPQKRKSVTFKDTVDTPDQGRKCEGLKMKISADIGKDGEKSPTNFKIIQNEPKIESIKLKVDATNKNVSIVKPVSPSPIKTEKQEKYELKMKKRLEKFERKNKLLERYQNQSKPGPKKSKIEKNFSLFVNSRPSQFKVPEASEVMPRKDRDEYEFEDEIDEQKLGFLSTFELAAKDLVASVTAPEKSKIKSLNSTLAKMSSGLNTSTNQTLPSSTSPVETSAQQQTVKRKHKDQVKATPKKFKYHMVTHDEAFQKKKIREGKEITFDLSPQPLGTKPQPSKVTMEMLQEMNKKAAEQAEKQAEKLATARPITPKKEQTSQLQPMRPPASVPIKPKKLPLLLPKGMEHMAHMNNAPNSFMIRRQELKKPPSEISVTRINDGKNVKVYGPKPQPKTVISPQMPMLAPATPNNDGFLFPFPPKQKSNQNTSMSSPQQPTFLQMQQMQAQQHLQQMQLQQQLQQLSAGINAGLNYGRPKAKILPLNTRTYGSRTPFYTPNSPGYSPSSPAYTPNYTQPNFKYTTGQYMNFMGNTYNGNSSSPPLSATIENSKKRPKEPTDSPQAKRKSPSPPQSDSDPKVLNILNKLSFPSSLSVTLTNEQEETKKEQVRYLKNNPVNNNIEIIKLPDSDNGKKSPSPPALSPLPPTNSPQSTQSKEFKVPADPKRPAPSSAPILPSVAAALKAAEAKETFQLKFLESIVHHQNKQAAAQKTASKCFKPPQEGSNQTEQKPISPPIDLQKSLKAPKPLRPKIDKYSPISTASELLAQQQRRKSLSPISLASEQMLKANALDLSGSQQPRKSQTPPAKLPANNPPQDIVNPAAVQLNMMFNALGAMPNFNNMLILDQLRKNMAESNALIMKRHNELAKEQQQQGKK